MKDVVYPHGQIAQSIQGLWKKDFFSKFVCFFEIFISSLAGWNAENIKKNKTDKHWEKILLSNSLSWLCNLTMGINNIFHVMVITTPILKKIYAHFFTKKFFFSSEQKNIASELLQACIIEIFLFFSDAKTKKIFFVKKRA